MTVKANAPETFAALSAVDWERHRNGHRAEPAAKAHGRLERREIDVMTPLPRTVDYPVVRQVARVVRHRERLGPTAEGKASAKEVLLITSLSAERASPAELLAPNRGH